LWDTFQDLDKNGDGRLDSTDMRAALSRSGIDLSSSTVQDIVRSLASGSQFGQPGKDGSGDEVYITFGEFRDFLIMLPRKATPFEIYKCESPSKLSLRWVGEADELVIVYQVRKRFSDGRGAARVDKEGDINVSFPKAPDGPQHSTASALFGKTKGKDRAVAEEQVQGQGQGDDFGDVEHEGEEVPEHEDRHEAWRFLLAGGIAGAGGSPLLNKYVVLIWLNQVSRTVTAPFDRLKIYLITTTSDPGPSTRAGRTGPVSSSSRAVANLWAAVGRIYADGGGLRAFWVGNGLNVTKIFPVRLSYLPYSPKLNIHYH
jgi:solute carrier family 25 phosphate transporter 23/24/25/41